MILDSQHRPAAGILRGFMKLCSDNHEEICFEGGGCPVCALRGEIYTWEQDDEKQKARIKHLEWELTEIAAKEAAKTIA